MPASWSFSYDALPPVVLWGIVVAILHVSHRPATGSPWVYPWIYPWIFPWISTKKSVDMDVDMDGKFHIHGKPEFKSPWRHEYVSPFLPQLHWFSLHLRIHQIQFRSCTLTFDMLNGQFPAYLWSLRGFIVAVIITIITRTMFIVLSSWQSYWKSSLGSRHEYSTAPSGHRPLNQANQSNYMGFEPPDPPLTLTVTVYM